MIYTGHFSFDEFGPEKEIRHGYFTCMVDTNSAEAAANEFKELILSLKKMDDNFSILKKLLNELDLDIDQRLKARLN